ncbi:MAG: RNA methyltransferase [Deltaproteobacteria bacterium]|nr:MAG: RNA methyltransferase [Deltaproteobacteria bacterium]
MRRHPRSGAVRAQLIRTAVLEIYEEVRREGARADQALQSVLRREKLLRSVERRAVSDAVYGLLRLQGRVDHLLQRALGTRKLALEKLATPTQHLLRYAAYLVVGERQSPESAAGLAGPEIATWSWALELVADPERLGAPDDPLDALAAETSLPRWLAKLWSEQLGSGETRALAAALNQRAPLTVRANLLRNTRDELIAALRAEGSRVEPTRLSPWGVTFTGRTNGKTLALASEMRNKGRLVACDRDGRRLDKVRPRARRAGVHNWEARSVPESSDARLVELSGQADVVLIDAPCSGLGALRRNPDARWRLEESEVDSFPPRQGEILERYARLVKPGGRLVYATCSINRRENEEVRSAFLSAHPDFEPAQALPQSVGLGVGSEVQLLPHRQGTDGFYIATMRRSR